MLQSAQSFPEEECQPKEKITFFRRLMLLQYPCLKNSMDRGAWQATVRGVAKSRTWLSNYHSLQAGLWLNYFMYASLCSSDNGCMEEILLLSPFTVKETEIHEAKPFAWSHGYWRSSDRNPINPAQEPLLFISLLYWSSEECRTLPDEKGAV